MKVNNEERSRAGGTFKLVSQEGGDHREMGSLQLLDREPLSATALSSIQ